mgnify:CR=1 FL=1
MKEGNNVMVHVKCSKEKELSKMHENISLIQKDVSYIRESFDNELKTIRYTVYGNGKKGLTGDMEDVKKYVNMQKGQFGLVKFFVGAGSVFSCLALIFSLII